MRIIISMKTTTKTATGTLQGMANRIAAVRAELSEAQGWAKNRKPGATTMVKALKKDLLALETNLAAAI